MSVQASRTCLVIGLWLATAACASSAAPSATPSPSAAPTEGVAGLPPGCQPITLLSPAGERVVLDGMWIQDVPEETGPMTWWILTEGDCVWGAGQTELANNLDPIPWDVQTLHGRITPAFTIEGAIVMVGPQGFQDATRYVDGRFLIEFDEAGGVILREDREPGVEGPRCPAPGAYCPDPLVLVPVAP